MINPLGHYSTLLDEAYNELYRLRVESGHISCELFKDVLKGRCADIIKILELAQPALDREWERLKEMRKGQEWT